MTVPRRILKGRTYEIVRRCAHREYRLQPTQAVNNLLRYLLGYAANRRGIEVHAFVVMSNHYHLMVTDTRGNLPAFMRDFNSLVARALNGRQGRWESFWASGSYDNVELLTPATIVAKLVYIITNPVKDGAVARHGRWPGLLTRPEHLGNATWKTGRPKQFFRRDGACPAETSLQLTLPPALAKSRPHEVQRRIGALVSRREQAYREHAKSRGHRCLGARAVKQIRPDYRPRTLAPHRRLRPRVAASGDSAARVAAIRALQQFRADYRAALDRYRRQEPTEFPAGTYAMRVLFSVPIAEDG